MDLTLKNLRFSYLTLYTPRAMKGAEGEEAEKLRYSVMLLGPKGGPAEKELHSAIESVARDKWGVKAEGVLKQLYASNKVCLKDGDMRLNAEGEVQEGYADHWYTSASATEENPPRVFNRFGDKVTAANFRELAMSDRRGPRSGDYGDAIVRIWAQDNNFGRRVNCQIIAVAFRKEGEALGRSEKSDDEMRSSFGSFETQSVASMME